MANIPICYQTFLGIVYECSDLSFSSLSLAASGRHICLRSDAVLHPILCTLPNAASSTPGTRDVHCTCRAPLIYSYKPSDRSNGIPAHTHDFPSRVIHILDYRIIIGCCVHLCHHFCFHNVHRSRSPCLGPKIQKVRPPARLIHILIDNYLHSLAKSGEHGTLLFPEST